MCIAAAIIGGAVVGGVASAYSGRKAAKASAKGAQQSADVQRYMYDTTRSDYAPYRQVGYGALNQLASLYGIGSYNADPQALTGDQEQLYNDWLSEKPPEYGSRKFNGFGGAIRGAAEKGTANKLYGDWVSQAPDFIEVGEDGSYRVVPSASNTQSTGQPDYSGFYNSPDYRFAYDEGMKSVEQSLARRGLSNSGAALKSLTRFGQGLASQQLGNYKNQLAALAGIGQTSTAQLGQFGQNAATQIGNAYQGAADSRASSYLNTGSAISNIANSYGQYRLMDKYGVTPTYGIS